MKLLGDQGIEGARLLRREFELPIGFVSELSEQAVPACPVSSTPPRSSRTLLDADTAGRNRTGDWYRAAGTTGRQTPV
jgi:hypothetical protein